MLLAATAIVFVGFVALSMPIVFALGIAGIVGLALGGFPLQMLPSSLVAGSQNWVLLAIPSFVFAGTLMERCGMSHALVDLARALVGWLRGGLGMSVIVVSYFFSDICGSKMAEVSALGSTLIPSLKLAGYIPAATIGLCLCILVFIQAHILGWPRDTRPSWRFLLKAAREAAVPMVVPVVIFGGFFFGVFTATEAGAIVAAYAFLAALFYYRNVTLREMFYIAYESALLTAAVIFLLAVATIFQYLMGVTEVPALLAKVLVPLGAAHWLFLLGTALMTMLFGMVLEGLPAAVVLIPVVFPIAKELGIHPIHFDIVQTAAVGIGLFLPPMGVG